MCLTHQFCLVDVLDWLQLHHMIWHRHRFRRRVFTWLCHFLQFAVPLVRLLIRAIIRFRCSLHSLRLQFLDYYLLHCVREASAGLALGKDSDFNQIPKRSHRHIHTTWVGDSLDRYQTVEFTLIQFYNTFIFERKNFFFCFILSLNLFYCLKHWKITMYTNGSKL